MSGLGFFFIMYGMKKAWMVDFLLYLGPIFFPAGVGKNICEANLVKLSTKIHKCSNINNSGIFYQKMLPKMANKRFYNIFFIFGVIWGNGVKG